MLCFRHHMWEKTLSHTVKLVHISEFHCFNTMFRLNKYCNRYVYAKFRNMENKNHMKTFPPQSQFLFCFKPIKLNNSTSEKICLFQRSLKVEIRVLKLNLNKNNSDITPVENTTGETGAPFHLKKILSIPDRKGIERIKTSQEQLLPLYKKKISTLFYKARLVFDTGLVD